jgi:flavin reductase (DIM6/NTAB) family NADH-FMN oxidoreductase RutF
MQALAAPSELARRVRCGNTARACFIRRPALPVFFAGFSTCSSDRFGRAGMTRLGSDTVGAARALEGPIQLEAVVAAVHGIGQDSDRSRGFISFIEVRILPVHVHPIC